MVERLLKPVFKILNMDYRVANERFNQWSIEASIHENRLGELRDKLRVIVRDISSQEESEKEFFNDYSEVKRRGLQAFQCSLMLKALEGMYKDKLTVVDIGDSAGTHMLYLKELVKDKFSLDTIGVNLDPRAIEKIRSRGLKAILCRAEDLSLDEVQVDMFTSFQMVEHLHNPAIFFYRLAKRPGCERMVVTVPYMRRSRVGLYQARRPADKSVYAEGEHVFELSPEDWKLLMLHSGWKVVYERIYRQYPKNIPVLSSFLASYWRRSDFEGFWGAILEKDTSVCDRYNDWETK